MHLPELETVDLAASPLVYRERIGYRRLQRIFDVAIALAVLVVAAPILALAALAIKLDDGGDVFFVQRRVGRFGKLFDIYKLRTMRSDSCGDALSPTSSRDVRVTNVGTFLRRTSIDELPQLFNVLNGTMAIVGPRPEQPFLVRQYEPWQQLRHLVKPGVTCLWQITCRSTVPLHRPQATALDLAYISQASFRTDSTILFRTIRAVFSTQGAY